MLSIGWFSTGRGEGSQGLLRFVHDRILQGCLDARIEFVFCNREHGQAEGSDRYFQLVEDYGIDLLTLSSAKFRKARRGPFARYREEFDSLVMECVGGFRPDYMRVGWIYAHRRRRHVPPIPPVEPPSSLARRPHRHLAGSDLGPYRKPGLSRPGPWCTWPPRTWTGDR